MDTLTFVSLALAAASKHFLRPRILSQRLSTRKAGGKQLKLRMSIDSLQRLETAAMDSSPAKHASEKKHKSKEGKKRKRDREDGDDTKRHKSKKRRKDESKKKSKSNSMAMDTEGTSGSPFHVQTSSIYLSLAPISQRQPLEGMCAEHLSPLILTYYPPFSGVILSYSNPRISERPFEDESGHVLLQCVDEYGAAFAWVTAEFLLFKPRRGGWLEGYITLQNEGHVGLVCWNLFNASIERQRLPKDWKWIGADGILRTNKINGIGQAAENGVGYFLDGKGNKVEGKIMFRIKDIESSHDRERGFLSIEGTMLDESAEKEVSERDHLSRLNSKDFIGRRLGGSRALGATSLGVPLEVNVDEYADGSGGSLKHRRRY